jgi:hypothetical protein
MMVGRACRHAGYECAENYFFKKIQISNTYHSSPWAFIFQSTSSVLLTLFGLTAGLGPVYALRWFWWRINALTQLTAMIGATLLSYFKMEILGLSWIQQMNNLLPLQPVYNELLILGCLNCLFWLPTLLIQNKEEKRKSKLRVLEIGLHR